MESFQIIGIAAIIIAFSCLVVISVLHILTSDTLSFDFTVVIDAGSSHSGIFLYKWLDHKVRKSNLPWEIGSCIINYGIHDFYNKTQIATNYKVCFESLSKIKKVKKHLHIFGYKIPVYVGATAGMRILNITNNLLAHKILKDLRYLIDNSVYKPIEVKILSGKDEALYAWTTLNYLTRNLIYFNRHDSVGILDMGGASTQIGYEDNTHFNKNLTLYQFSYNIFIESHLCFGAQEFENRYRQHLVKINNFKNIIYDPCTHFGYDSDVAAFNFLNSICVKERNMNDSNNVQNVNLNRTFKFLGQYNFEKCSQIVTQLLNIENCSQTYHYCPKPQPEHSILDRKFYAVGNFYFSSLVFNSSFAITGQKYIKETIKWCKRDWSTVVDRIKIKYLSKYCFYLHQNYYTLKNIYKFSDEQFKYIKFAEKIGNNTLSWAMGFMVNYPYIKHPITLDSWLIPGSTLLPLIVFFAVIVIGSLIYIKWHQESRIYYPKHPKFSNLSNLAQLQLNTLFQPTKIRRSIGQINLVRNG